MSNLSIKNKKLVLVFIIAILLLSSLGVFLKARHQNVLGSSHSIAQLEIDGVLLPQPRHINDFVLTDNSGKRFTKDNLKGHWTLVLFGFTNCGYVCPTTLAELSKTYQALEKEEPPKNVPQILMISVDPERDTVSRMNDYLKSFNSHFIGARGSLEETNRLAKEMSVTFAKVQMDNGNYMVNHSAEIMLLNPQGNLIAFFSYPHKMGQMKKDYQAILKQLGAS